MGTIIKGFVVGQLGWMPNPTRLSRSPLILSISRKLGDQEVRFKSPHSSTCPAC